jgi:hypothetical protein
LKKWIVALGAAAVIAAALVFVQQRYYGAKPDGCMPVAEFDVQMADQKSFQNLRPVAPEHLKDALQVYGSIPPEDDRKWDNAYLMDGPEDTGILIVGSHGDLCGVASFSKGYWRALVNMLEPPKV